MQQASRVLLKGHRSYGMVTDHVVIEDEPVYFMNAAEIKERFDLNIANTASNLRARVLSELSKQNGHSSSGGSRIT